MPPLGIEPLLPVLGMQHLHPCTTREAPTMSSFSSTFVKAERVVWRTLGYHAAFAVSGRLVLPLSPPKVTPDSPNFSGPGEHHFCCKHFFFKE